MRLRDAPQPEQDLGILDPENHGRELVISDALDGLAVDCDERVADLHLATSLGGPPCIIGNHVTV